MIYFKEDVNLDLIIKQMIKQMKEKKYSYTFLNSENKLFDEKIINILKSNNFEGNEFLFLNL